MKKKLWFPAGLAVLSIITAGTVYAVTSLPVISQACEMTNGQLISFNDGFSSVTECSRKGRVVSLGSPAVTTNSFYVRTQGPFNADPGIASTVIHGCNPGDISIGGGMDSYSGAINNWRTVRSGPTESTDMNGWQTTVINEGTTPGTFSVATKCFKITQ